jgi:hypothetical protein
MSQEHVRAPKDIINRLLIIYVMLAIIHVCHVLIVLHVYLVLLVGHLI